jgi:hypothetical protein
MYIYTYIYINIYIYTRPSEGRREGGGGDLIATLFIYPIIIRYRCNNDYHYGCIDSDSNNDTIII